MGHDHKVAGQVDRSSAGAAVSLLDPDRLAAVRSTGLMDSAASASFDRLARLAATLVDAPLAFVTIVDDRRSYWVSCIGVDLGAGGTRQNTVEESFCQYVVADGAPVIVEDATIDPRTRLNPSVVSMGVRAWAGFPLLSPDGQTLGSFCAVDLKPRPWTTHQVAVLSALAEAASAQIAVLASADAEMAALAAVAQEQASSRHASDRIHHLASSAIEMTSADTYEELAAIVVDRRLALLGADGGALVIREADDSLRAVLSDNLGGYDLVDLNDRSFDDALPGRYAARSGKQILLMTRAEGVAFHPAMADLYDATGLLAWAFLPLRTGTDSLGVLAVSWYEQRQLEDEELVVLESIAAQCSQAVYRIQQLAAARGRAEESQNLSESLQRSLLTQPPTPEALSIAVRYRPAAEVAKVGGDWYDAFVTASGVTTVVIGDVTGHDGLAAAAMAQLRNLLRGIAYHSTEGPAWLLARLDAAMAGLEVGGLATAIVAQIDQTSAGAELGLRRLRWSNAGHLSALLRHPDGTVEALERPADLMLGYDPGAQRSEHHVDLLPGSVVLLYTDGLVEGRQASLDDGIAQLVGILGGATADDPEGLCDAVLDAGIVTDSKDDTAMLALFCGDTRRGTSPSLPSPSPG